MRDYLQKIMMFSFTVKPTTVLLIQILRLLFLVDTLMLPQKRISQKQKTGILRILVKCPLLK